MTRFLKNVWRDEVGQDLVEYAMLAGFVALAGTFTFPEVAVAFSNVYRAIENVVGRMASML